MSRGTRWCIVSVLFLASLYGWSQSRKERQVQQLARDFVACFNKPDAVPLETIDDLLSDDFVQVSSSGRAIVGKTENRDMYRKSREEIDQAFEDLKFDFDIQSIKVLHRKTAVVFGVLVCYGTIKGGQAFQRKIHETLVFTRQDRKWRLVHEHSSRID